MLPQSCIRRRVDSSEFTDEGNLDASEVEVQSYSSKLCHF